jgi:cytochrome c peroxidase
MIYIGALLVFVALSLGAGPISFAEMGPAKGTVAAEPITPIPAPPVLDPARLSLGERLFHATRLSRNNATSCATCHDTQSNGASARAHDLGPDGRPLPLNTPTVFNAALSFRLNWTGKHRSLEDQAAQSFPDTMGVTPEEAVAKLSSDAELSAMFRKVYGREPHREGLLDAIATYERSLLTPGSRFDQWLSGDENAITQAELAGYQLFKSLGCVSCHQGVNIGGNMFQRHGVFHPLASHDPVILRVPSLRNVMTAPRYFHDGSAATIEEAVRAMGRAQLDRVLTDAQVEAIVAFLNTLTGNYLDHPVTRAPEAGGSGAPP